MTEHDPIGADARAAAHLRSLGPPPHMCAFCGVSDPGDLRAKPLKWAEAHVPRNVLEQHHVVGRQHEDNLIVLLCISCHFKVSQRYFEAGIDLQFEPNPHRRIALMLEALAVFYEMLADVFRRWAAILKGAQHDGEDH